MISELEIIKRIENKGYGLLSFYRCKNYVNINIEDNDGYKYSWRLDRLENNPKPPIVHRGNHYSLENISNWLKNNKKEFLLISDKYNDSKSDLLFYCYKCKDYFYSSWNEISSQKGCGVCFGKQVGKFHSLSILYPMLAQEWSSKNEIPPEKVTFGSEKKVIWVCSICSFEWESKVEHRTISNSGCPNCSSSKGEKQIFNFLIGRGIENFPQYRFQNCKHKRSLPFDFYLLKHNLCVEYHGGQHYEENKFFGGEVGFKQRKKNDKIKEKYCKDNDIRLLIIPYWEFENIEKILEETLSELG